MSVVWTFRSARRLTSLLETHLIPIGFHVGMTGSVLHSGKSLKDLDIIIYPRRSPITLSMINTAYDVMKKIGMMQRADRAKTARVWRDMGSLDKKWVEVWRYKGKRVDVFILE